MSDIRRTLKEESEAAKSLLLNLRDILADDEEAKADTIEGETNLLEAIQSAVARLGEIESMKDGIKVYADGLAKRKSRLEDQAEHIRAAILAAMSIAEIKKLELPIATISVAATPPKALPIMESEIPSQFWKRSDPKLDLRALLAALKEGPVPGAELSNGGESLKIKRN